MRVYMLLILCVCKVYMSLIRSCSCPLKRDIEYLNSLGNIENSDLIPCTDYIPLWEAICNIEKELTEHNIVSGQYTFEFLMYYCIFIFCSTPSCVRTFATEKKKFETVREKGIQFKVFDVFVKNVLNILGKLDFSVIEDDYNSNGVTNLFSFEFSFLL